MSDLAHRGLTSLFAAIAIGVFLGALCLALGFFAFGSGHGWGTPALYGGLSLVFYPLAMLRLLWLDRETPWSVDFGLTFAIAVPALIALGVGKALPPPPAFVAIKWLILGGIPALYWLIGRILEPRKLHGAFADAMLMTVGISLDISAISELVASPVTQYKAQLATFWAPVWLGWQVIAFAALLRHVRPRPQNGSSEHRP